MKLFMCAAALGVLLTVGTGQSSAQVWFAPAPVVSYYTPAPVASYSVAPTVSYYAPAMTVAPVVTPMVTSVPTWSGGVSYYGPATVTYPVRVSRGLFGRTIVRTPFSVSRY